MIPMYKPKSLTSDTQKPKLEVVLPPFFKDYMVSLQKRFIALLLPLNLPAEKLAKDLGDANVCYCSNTRLTI